VVLKKETGHFLSSNTTCSAQILWQRCFLCAFGGSALQRFLGYRCN